MDIKIALLDKEQVNDAIVLVEKVYTDEGYVNASSEKKDSISKYLKIEDTTTYGLYIEARLVGTISIVKDGSEGLPLDQIFLEEMTQVRSPNSKIGEVCQFAIDKNYIRSLVDEGSFSSMAALSLSRQLLQQVFLYGIENKFSDFVFAINPKHKVFYEKLGARQIGTVKYYASVNEAPALLYRLCLAESHIDPIMMEAAVGVRE